MSWLLVIDCAAFLSRNWAELSKLLCWSLGGRTTPFLMTADATTSSFSPFTPTVAKIASL